MDVSRSGWETHDQVALTYSGVLSYELGENRWLIDTNRTLFIERWVEYRTRHPVAGVGHAALFISPSNELFEEVSFRRASTLRSAFRTRSAPSTMRLRLLAQHILNLKPDADNTLLRDEWVIRTLTEALHLPPPLGGRPPKLVDRTKELLHARLGEHLSLKEIATEIGVSPTYLTQEFTRCEGKPLYRYQLQLRLSRALLDLPNCNDITGLALDLGFSNHSHFTSVFRKAFGVTPSKYRSQIGSRRFLLKEDRDLHFGEARRRAA